jgi:hypothetical protein
MKLTPKDYYKNARKEWKKFCGKEWVHISVYDDPPSLIQEMFMRCGAECIAAGAFTIDEKEDVFNALIIKGQMRRDLNWSLRG